jgi:hypothetical protein
MANERIGREPDRGKGPPASENPEMPESETISEFGELAAKKRAIAIERDEDPESGGVAEQRAYLRREARIDKAEREDRADRADIHNTPNVPHKE